MKRRPRYCTNCRKTTWCNVGEAGSKIEICQECGRVLGNHKGHKINDSRTAQGR